MSQKLLEQLFKLPPYILKDKEKNKILLQIVKQQLVEIKKNKFLKNFFKRQKINLEDIDSLEKIPPLPVNMFKYFDLRICPKKDVLRILESSGTTGNLVSKIPLNKKTMLNQTKALKSILADFLGEKRKTFLVIDHPEINQPGQKITARTAGVRGLSMYAKKMFFLLEKKGDQLQLNLPLIKKLARKYKNQEIYVFGFTYIIWSVFLKKINKTGLKFNFKNIQIFHSGGWKKLEKQKISKTHFSQSLAKIFNCEPGQIHDFYGMAEQTGIIFVDCQYGYKHVPNFCQVIIRNPQTLLPCKIGETGLIEIVSILANSYYSQAILTEDQGKLCGIDDCRCQRKGKYFKFVSRMEKAELRGCGDTFRE